jgi:hypothetical protein
MRRSERQIWPNALCLVAFGSTVAAFLLGAAAKGRKGNHGPDVVRAKRFVVVDDAGQEVGEFGFDQGSVRLRIPGKRGEPGVFVGTHREGTRGVVLFDGAGQPIGEFILPGNDYPPLLRMRTREQAAGEQGRRLALYVAPDGWPGLSFYDKDGNTRRLGLYVGPDGTPGMALFDGKGNVTWQAPPEGD